MAMGPGTPTPGRRHSSLADAGATIAEAQDALHNLRYLVDELTIFNSRMRRLLIDAEARFEVAARALARAQGAT